MKYKVNIWVSFRLGGYAVNFNKKFILPFAPFEGLIFIDGNKSKGLDNCRVEFKTTEYKRCDIIYHKTTSSFEVDVTHLLRSNHSHFLKEEIKMFTEYGWKRKDNENVERMIELMELENNKKK